MVEVVEPRLLFAAEEAVEFLGVVGGNAWEVEAQNTITYVAVGNRLEITNVSDPAHPITLSSTLLRDSVASMRLRDNVLFVSLYYYGLYIYDVSNPANPTLLGTYAGNTYAEDMALSGNRAYLLGQNNGLHILDISDLTHPTLLGRMSTDSWVQDLAVSGNYLYFAGPSLQVYDVSMPAQPTYLATISSEWTNAIDIAGSTLVTAESNGTVRVFDLTTPAAPQQVGQTTMLINPRSISITDSRAYIGISGYGFQVVDLANPTAPEVLAWYNSPGMYVDVAVVGDRAYLANGERGMMILDLAGIDQEPEVALWRPAAASMRVITAGSRAYVGTTNGLDILDITNPGSPVLLSSVDVAAPYALALSGSTLFLGTTLGLQVVDVSNPVQPQLGASLALQGGIDDAVVVGSRLYATSYGVDLRIIDVSNVTAPFLVGEYDTPAMGSGIGVSGDFAYVASGSSGLVVFDVSNPAVPTRTGAYTVAGDYIYSVVAQGDTVFMGGTSLWIMDSQDPLHLQVIGSLRAGVGIQDLAISGTAAYLATYNQGVQAVDISSLLTPRFLGAATTGYLYGISVNGGYLYAAGSDGVHVLDAALLERIRLVGRQGIALAPSAAVTRGTLLFTACGFDGMRIFDMQDPSNPVEIGSFEVVGDVSNIVLSGQYAYVAARNDGIRIVDISDPTAPRLVGQCTVPGDTYDLVIQGHYAYLASWSGGVNIVDIGNPAAPVLVGSYKGTDTACAVAIQGSALYVAASDDGLLTLDVSDATAPRLVNTSRIAPYVFDVKVQGSYLLVSAYDRGLMVMSLTDPFAPQWRMSYDAGYASRIFIDERYAYVTTAQGEVLTLDLRDAGNPVAISTTGILSPFAGGRIIIQNHTLYLAAASNGLFIYDIRPPAQLREDAPVGTALGSMELAQLAGTTTSASMDAASLSPAGYGTTFTLVNGPGSTDNALFRIVDGTLVTAAQLDFETKDVYSVRIRATSSPYEPTYEQVFSVTVDDVSEAPTDLTLSSTGIAENQPGGTVVGSLSTADPDAGDTFVYSLVGGVGDTDNALFTISNGQLLSAASFNYETRNSYSIRARTTDQAGLFFEKAFTISITDLDEIAPGVSSVATNDGAAQRSMVKKLAVVFSEPVTLSASALQVKLSDGTLPANTTVTVANPSGDQKTYVVTFSGTAVFGGSLADGIYDLLVAATGVQDLAGNPLTANYSQRFHRLFGDSDGNRVVNALDYARLKNTFARTSSDPLFNSAFDYEGNGLINALDLARFRQRYGLSFAY